MPDSRSERIAFAVGLAAILALAIALIPAYSHYRSSSSPGAPSVDLGSSAPAEQTAYRPKQTPTPAVQPKRTHRTTQTQTPKKTTPAVTAPAAAKQAKVSLTASRGDCWVEVRNGSAKGKILYVATLAKGKSFKVTGAQLWLRFGAPQNVDLVINGKPTTIPGGSQDFLVTPKGVSATA